jgi:hypothetical protein
MRYTPVGRLSLVRERGRVRVHRTQQKPGSLKTPHLSPLPFFEGRGEKSHADCRANLISQNAEKLVALSGFLKPPA